MYKHVLNFMDSKNVIYRYQFGFREGHSTQQTIITLVEKITSSLDSDNLVSRVFLDLKKSFHYCRPPDLCFNCLCTESEKAY